MFHASAWGRAGRHEFKLFVDRVEVAARLIGLSSELTADHSVRPQAASNA